MKFKDPVIYKMPRWLTQTFKVLGAIVLLPFVLLIIAAIIGWISDLTISSKWAEGRKKALEIVHLAKETEYKSGYAFAVNEANAWNYYLKSSENIDNPTKTREIDDIIFNDKFSLKDANRLLLKYQKQISLWDSGACCRYCLTPVEYEKGYKITVPNYGAIQKVLKLALLKGKCEFAEGKSQQGALTYAKAFKTASDISGGSEMLIGRMVGIAAGNNINRVIAVDFDKFDAKSISLLSDVITKTEEIWPRLYSSMEMEAYSYYFAFDDKEALPFLKQNYIFCWKHYFSVKRSLINLFKLQQKLLTDVKNSYSTFWIDVKPILDENKKVIDNSLHGDLFASLFFPNHVSFIKREYEYRMTIRLLKDAFKARKQQISTAKNPFGVSDATKDSVAYYDIASGKPIKYSVDGKIVKLYSIGLNLKDDQGQGRSIAENPYSNWNKDSQDDIWIKLK